jgi:uncharacterized protein (DUF427 family)
MPDLPDNIKKEIEKLRNVHRDRPEKAIAPGPGQESVWDYPRPPKIAAVTERIRVLLNGLVIADSSRAHRVLETASPPVYYLPPEDVRMDLLESSDYSTICEWKGVCQYWSVRAGNRLVENAAWSYPEPLAGYEAIQGHIAFYAGKMDACYVGQYLVTPQAGDYYGGWVTPNIVGPFKGEPGTEGW